MMPSPKSQVVCSFYLTNSCTKGENCAFSHGRPSRVACKYYSLGSCRFGDLCRNSHEGLGGAVPNRLPCIFWKRGSCLRGDQCQFFHESFAQQSDSTSWREPQSQFTSSPVNDIKPASKQILTQSDGEKSSEHHCRANTQTSNMDAQESLSRSPESVPNILNNPEVTHPDSGPLVERSFLNGVRALIGPGGDVQKVITAFDSCHVTLANVPDDATHQEIITLADTFGPLKSAILPPATPGTRWLAKLEYLDSESAKVAAETLDGVELHSRQLTAQLDLRLARIGLADLRSSMLKMSWFAPARIAYAHYDSMFDAHPKAEGLQNKDFTGRNVTTVFQQPSPRQSTNFTVIIKNLPLHINMEDLKKFCRGKSVVIGKASYQGNEGLTKVQELLEMFSPLESFDRSHPSPNDIKVKVLVRFAKPEHATAAAEKLQGQSQPFLGGVKIWVTLLHSIKYNISRAQYRVLQANLRRFSTGDFQSAKVRVFEYNEQGRSVGPVCIRIYGDDPKVLGRLKTQVDALVSGEEVMHEGTNLWDGYFFSSRGKVFVDEVRMKSRAFIRLDSRRRKLCVSGTFDQKGRARDLLLQKFLELRAQRHQLSLTRHQLSSLLQGELARLQGILGEDKLSLNIRDKTLIVRGDDEDIQAACLSLSMLQQTSDALPSNQSGDCPVCFCAVTTPVMLTCGHSYCFSCLRHYLTSAKNFPVKCLAEDGRCDLPISLSTISDMLPVGQETKFYDDAFLTYICQHPKEYNFCPSPDCQQIYRPADPGSILRCPSCLSRICPSCHVEFHEGLTCAEHCDNETGGMSAYQKWKEENNVQSCPNCNVDIEKSMGCNHITCIRCGSHICWVCLEMWQDGSVIYQHMNSVHGGFGL